ncbi:MAG: hypothetical protein SWK90_19980 [Chloroflexota bacterium]|nr:hypothetical protein [Chloroflexota bacterium]
MNPWRQFFDRAAADWDALEVEETRVRLRERGDVIGYTGAKHRHEEPVSSFLALHVHGGASHCHFQQLRRE